MIELIIGLGILGFGISLCFQNETFEFFGILINILSIIFLMMHIPIWLSSTYRYEMHIVERNSFIESLETARVNKNNIELASISKDILEYNKKLAILKYENTGFLDCYIDDRLIELKPIK
jgi:hypothetical protein